MDLTEADIEEFAALWQDEFGEAIAEPEARHHASQLLELYLLLARLRREESAGDGSLSTHA